MFSIGDEVKFKDDEVAAIIWQKQIKLEKLVIRDIYRSNSMVNFKGSNSGWFTRRLEHVDTELQYDPEQQIDDEDDL